MILFQVYVDRFVSDPCFHIGFVDTSDAFITGPTKYIILTVVGRDPSICWKWLF